MIQLDIRPGYNHSHVSLPPPTTLVADSGITTMTYHKLRLFLAIQKHCCQPSGNWPKKWTGVERRDLFTVNGFHQVVQWKPIIKEEEKPYWRRLTYYEWCKWYGIKI